jgi:predicted dehydrogenase
MPRTTPERLGEAFVTELQAFVDSIQRQAEPPVTGADSRATVKVALAATKAMHTGQAVAVMV